jgi:hypothetical protein
MQSNWIPFKPIGVIVEYHLTVTEIGNKMKKKKEKKKKK